jgi:hypothetical protein
MLIKKLNFAGKSVGISLGIYRRYKCNISRRRTNERANETTYEFHICFLGIEIFSL